MKETRQQRRANERALEKAGLTAPKSFSEKVWGGNEKSVEDFLQRRTQEIRSELIKAQLGSNANMLSRITVLERVVMEKCGESLDSLAERLTDNEDQALGLKRSKEPVKKGDTVRVSLRGAAEKADLPANKTKHVFRRYGHEPGVFNPVVEEGLAGMVEGETKLHFLELGTHTEVDGSVKPLGKLQLEVTVDRISSPLISVVPTPAPTKTDEELSQTETANVRQDNASTDADTEPA